jgi:hypothetical protein
MSESNARAEGTVYGTIVIVGGGCYGTYYLTQLRRARAAGALTFERLVVVDRDAACQAAQPIRAAADPTAELAVQEWTPFFDEYFAHVSPDSRDAIVPSPLMPHLMYEWVLRRARARWPDRDVATRPLPVTPDVPWRRTAPDGTEYVSYASWMCPINCIEPRRCPHTRGERTWTMPDAARDVVSRTRSKTAAQLQDDPGIGVTDNSLQGPVIFHCTHRAYGVGMFDTRDVLAGDALVTAAAERGPADILIGTVSHCHGALNVLHVGALTAAPASNMSTQ